MEIIVKDIPEEGLQLHFISNQEVWLQNCLVDSLGEFYQKEDQGLVEVKLFRTGVNVDCAGRIRCDCFPTCSRCLKVFRQPLDIPFHLTLAPLYESEQELKRLEKEGVELVREDLEFSYYEGNRFSLSGILREQVILNLPIQPVCDPKCKGLCPKCGQNLNEAPCRCPKEGNPKRWSTLKNISLKS